MISKTQRSIFWPLSSLKVILCHFGSCTSCIPDNFSVHCCNLGNFIVLSYVWSVDADKELKKLRGEVSTNLLEHQHSPTACKRRPGILGYVWSCLVTGFFVSMLGNLFLHAWISIICTDHRHWRIIVFCTFFPLLACRHIILIKGNGNILLHTILTFHS